MRDEYYRYVFDLVHKAKNHNGLLAGCNFWAWGGFANHTLGHMFWEKGDDYMGDPVQEEQGLNSVFITDSTIKIISEANKQLKYD